MTLNLLGLLLGFFFLFLAMLSMLWCLPLAVYALVDISLVLSLLGISSKVWFGLLQVGEPLLLPLLVSFVALAHFELFDLQVLLMVPGGCRSHPCVHAYICMYVCVSGLRQFRLYEDFYMSGLVVEACVMVVCIPWPSFTPYMGRYWILEVMSSPFPVFCSLP